MLPIDQEWEDSPEYDEAYVVWNTFQRYVDFEQSQAFRDARLAFRKRVQRHSKGTH